MTTKDSPRIKIVRAAVKKYPDKPKLTIAKLLSKQYPDEFPTPESARASIRYVTGAHGNTKLAMAKSSGALLKKDIRKPGTLTIPDGVRQSKQPVIVADGKYLVSCDWHTPYHDKVCLDAQIKYAVDAKCDSFYLNGDGIDFYKSSVWDQDPQARDMLAERDTLHSILDVFDPHFKKKYYKIGNHEDRYTRRLWQRCPELAVLPEFDVGEVLRVKERGYQIVHSKQFAKFGSLWMFHGHELAKGLTSPVNAARGIYLRSREQSAAGHYHRTSSHIEMAGVTNKMTVTHSIGCSCNLAPEYAPVNSWNHGFAIVIVSGKTYQFENYMIDRGKVYST